MLILSFARNNVDILSNASTREANGNMKFKVFKLPLKVDYAISDMINNRYIEYLDILIIPSKPFTLAIKKDGSKDI